MSTKVKIPDNVTVAVSGDKITVTGTKGSAERNFPVRNISIKVTGADVEISAEKKMIENTFVAHLQNMLKGVQAPFEYRLKVAYVHFPMTVEVKNGEFAVNNFLGERRTRKTRLPKNVEVKIAGEIITVQSPDIELAGKTASLIEQLTRISNRDRRTFLDGIFMIEKPGVSITA